MKKSFTFLFPHTTHTHTHTGKKSRGRALDQKTARPCDSLCFLLLYLISLVLQADNNQETGNYAPHALSALELASVHYGAATPAQDEAPRVR